MCSVMYSRTLRQWNTQSFSPSELLINTNHRFMICINVGKLIKCWATLSAFINLQSTISAGQIHCGTEGVLCFIISIITCSDRISWKSSLFIIVFVLYLKSSVGFLTFYWIKHYDSKNWPCLKYVGRWVTSHCHCVGRRTDLWHRQIVMSGQLRATQKTFTVNQLLLPWHQRALCHLWLPDISFSTVGFLIIC